MDCAQAPGVWLRRRQGCQKGVHISVAYAVCEHHVIPPIKNRSGVDVSQSFADKPQFRLIDEMAALRLDGHPGMLDLEKPAGTFRIVTNDHVELARGKLKFEDPESIKRIGRGWKRKPSFQENDVLQHPAFDGFSRESSSRKHSPRVRVRVSSPTPQFPPCSSFYHGAFLFFAKKQPYSKP